MSLPVLTVLAIVFGLSEFALSMFRRSASSSRDGRSLRLLWSVILLSMTAGFVLKALVPGAALPWPRVMYAAGVGLFAAGTLLRWYAIIYLGRYFTVNVALRDDHRVIDSGPYRRVRHPSYSGSLLQFAGLGLCLGNGLSLLALVLPVFLAFLRRMQIEEAVLSEGLGDAYRTYMQRTKRLLPLIY